MKATRQFALAAVVLLLAMPRSRAQDASATQDGTQRQGQSGYGGQRGQGRNGMGRPVRGTVTAASGNNVTLKTEQGETWTVVTTDNTRINIDRQPVKASDVKPGDEVMAMGIADPDKHEIHAMMLGGISAAQVAKLKADMGKTYIVGRITAINDTKLTIERPDHVSQTIALDETTSLKRGGRLPAELMAGGGMFGGGGGRRGGRDGAPGGNGAPPANLNNETTGGMPPGMEGESITLADVKVGDNIAGTGALKSGTFVPSDLHVLVQRPRGPRPDGGAAPGSTSAASPRP
ncbi:DUF5666 domain-containing protein [Terriglobus aquaticus]|uniref:DUF5666 domain-containing protein n=1 Tax=Terriglobus aquaticus TaxID=940139 RepID=A0ABW9KI16_9BACT|nr:DUF5666 domain-containing protein [Terriglobus aquaticus]